MYKFRFGQIDSTADLLTNSDQHLKTTYSYQESEDGHQSLIENQSVNSIQIKTGSGTILTAEKNETSEALKYVLEVRSGDLGKSGPGPRAKADAKQRGSSSPFVHRFVPQHTSSQHHNYKNYKLDPPFSWKTRVKVSDSSFQGDGNNNQPPPENPPFDGSQFIG